MKSLPLPTFSVLDVFRRCYQGRQDADLVARMAGVESGIDACDRLFQVAAAHSNVRSLVQASFKFSNVTDAELIANYTERLVGSTGEARVVYDKIRSSSAMCVLCGARTVSTLDHHLPKTKYPALSVNPFNLIPACFECNKVKSSDVPRNEFEEPLHPYYENIETVRWLGAIVAPGDPLMVDFFVDRPAGWSNVLFARVQKHFERLKLHSAYSKFAGDEISAIEYQYSNLRCNSGPDGVRAELENRALSSAHHTLNGWRTATYAALAASDRYCLGAYSL